jgi:hypothetical protein
MNEGEYLEMANHFKEEIEKKDQEMKKLKDVNIELKKILFVSYGFIRVIDYFSEEDEDFQQELKDLIDMLRGYLSSMLDDFIF